MKKMLLAAVAALALGAAADAAAQTRVTLKSAQTGTSYYLMTVQIGEALKAASAGKMTATVEESQGSVQNVKEAARRPGNFVFTTPPGLLEDARAGKRPFEGETGFDAIRGLFPVPGITMHWIVRADAGVNDLTDLAGKDFIPGGRGTAGQRLTIAAFQALGMDGKVKLVDTELASAPAAVRNRQVTGFVTASAPSLAAGAGAGGDDVGQDPVADAAAARDRAADRQDRDRHRHPQGHISDPGLRRDDPLGAGRRLRHHAHGRRDRLCRHQGVLDAARGHGEAEPAVGRRQRRHGRLARRQAASGRHQVLRGSQGRRARHRRGERGFSTSLTIAVAVSNVQDISTAILAWAVVTVAFHLWPIFSGLIPNLVSRPLHLLLTLPWIFFIGVKGSPLVARRRARVGGIGMAACLYIILDRDRLLDQYGALQGWHPIRRRDRADRRRAGDGAARGPAGAAGVRADHADLRTVRRLHSGRIRP